MNTLFCETFETLTDNLPGGWFVEYNSDLKMVPAFRCGEKCIELLSAGNKFLPMIPDVSNCSIRFTLSFNFTMTKNDREGGFAYYTSFRYDTASGRGQTLKMRRNNAKGTVVFEYGTMRRNKFTAVSEKEMIVSDDELDKPFDVRIDIKDEKLTATAFNQSIELDILPGKGKIAISRAHFFDILKILAYEIETDEILRGEKKSFTVPVSEAPTMYPLFCDIELEDFGNCMDVSLALRGGVKESPAGEGTYSGKRMDLLTNPYIKIISAEKNEKHITYNDRIVNMPDGLAHSLFYKLLAREVEWPFKRRVRFLKPAEKFDLAFGFDSFRCTPTGEFAENPSETVFDLDGNILYSGLGITEVIKTELLSQPDKEMLERLPKSDVRYDKAVEFVKNNHFFFEGEAPLFKVRLSGCHGLPLSAKITLEDAFLRPVRELEYKFETGNFSIGVRKYEEYLFIIEKLDDLECGLWHLRFESTDMSVEEVQKYWAFEVMSREKGALPPPLISGLPYLYNSRTETRGLATDAFDPWFGKSANAPHYIACANFLPPAARKFNVFETVRAYGRENFTWLAPRCLNDIKYSSNMDLINQTDYISMTDEIATKPLIWLYTHTGFVLEKLIEFVEKLNDENFDIPQLKKWLAEGGHIDQPTFIYLAENYWEEWQDYINFVCHKRKVEILELLRKTNPRIRYAQYGPAPIYASKLKGPEYVRQVQHQYATTDSDAFWQFEDYPFACRYDQCYGSYFLTSCLLMLPGARFYPEIYTDGGLGYCGDGAVYYAHPPFGRRPISYPQRMFKSVYEFCYGVSYYNEEGFKFWEKAGFQACAFNQLWYESLLKAWRIYIENKPASPVFKAAFVYSDASRRAAKETQFIVRYPQYRIMDVRNTASEDVPYIAHSLRKQGFPQGYQICEENILKLTPEDVSLLVLPPLKGMAAEVLEHIRKLHSQGVALIACEDASGLEDIFGVRDSGIRKNVTRLAGINGFMAGCEEFCDDERCTGKWEAVDAEILIDAEIPILTVKHNPCASAAFFNVPSHLVKEDRLHDRFTCGKDGISDFMERAVGMIVKMISPSVIKASSDVRILADHTVNGDVMIPVYNWSDSKTVSVIIEISPALINGRNIISDCPVTCISDGRYRLRLEPDASTYLLIK